MGYVKDTTTLYAKLDVLISTSKLEGLSNVCLEAMLLGVGVVSTDSGGVRDVVKHKETGILVQSRNSTSLANAVCSLLDNTAHYDTLIQSAHKHVLENFALERIARRLGLLYNAPSSTQTE